MQRRLIVNADDFGFTRDVNSGIVEACERGILRATTLMANGSAFEHAVELAQRTPSLDVGCHLTLIGGRSVKEPSLQLPVSVGRLLWRLSRDWSAAAIEAEFAAQVERLQAAGIQPTHLDTHKHTHLLPRVLDALLLVAQRYEVPWIRRPFDVPLTAATAGSPWKRQALSRALRPLSGSFDRKIADAGCRATDHFAGFQITGRYRAQELASLIRSLPAGATELMTHPGHCTDELRATQTRLKESRAAELQALTSPEALRAIEETGVEVTSYAQLSRAQ